MKVLKITLDGSSSFIAQDNMEASNSISDAFGWIEFLDEGNVGDKLTMEVIEMSDSELEALPDFEGF